VGEGVGGEGGLWSGRCGSVHGRHKKTLRSTPSSVAGLALCFFSLCLARRGLGALGAMDDDLDFLIGLAVVPAPPSAAQELAGPRDP